MKILLMLLTATLLFGATAPKTATTNLFETIKKRGTLRVIAQAQVDTAHLSRKGALDNQELEYIKDFGEQNGLKITVIYYRDRDKMIPALLNGKGDLIAAALTATDTRKELINFSLPLTLVNEVVITRKDDKTIKTIADLKGRTIAIQKSSSFNDTLKPLLVKYPEIKVEIVPENLDSEQILDYVATKKYDITIVDSNLFASVKTYRNDLKSVVTIAKNRVIAWGIRKGDLTLKKKLDGYINRHHVDLWNPRLYKDDLPGLKKRKVIRILTRNNATSYFLYRGKILGFEYELSKYFAKKHKLRVEFVVPQKQKNLIPWLKKGKGDIIASSITIPKEIPEGVAFSRYYNKVSELVITRTNDKKLKKIEDLKGRTIVIRKSSSYWATAERLKKSGIDFKLVAAPEDMETEEIIENVETGKFDLTIADSHIMKIEMTLSNKIKSAFAIGVPVTHGWVVRKENKKLKAALDQFFKKEYRGLIYNMTYNKYFKNKRRIKRTSALRADKTGAISPYDKLVQKYAKKYNYDWVMITSQMFQESNFNPKAKSWVGALGLMQVMPKTGLQMGFKDLVDPEKGIYAGVKYMNWVRRRFEAEIPAKDRTWFTLASYNAGYGHVVDARTIARKMGLNPNKWFGNVEKAMLMLSKPKYYRKARYGYCRCTEPVKYVSEIKTRYEDYKKSLNQK